MTKTVTSISIEADLRDWVKMNGLNLSKVVEEAIRAEMQDSTVLDERIRETKETLSGFEERRDQLLIEAEKESLDNHVRWERLLEDFKKWRLDKTDLQNEKWLKSKAKKYGFIGAEPSQLLIGIHRLLEEAEK